MLGVLSSIILSRVGARLSGCVKVSEMHASVPTVVVTVPSVSAEGMSVTVRSRSAETSVEGSVVGVISGS